MGAEQWRIAVPGIAAVNAAAARVADASPAATTPRTVDVFVLELGLVWGGVTLGLNAWVDVSISGLPFLETAKFLNSVHSERVLVPADILNKLDKRVHLKVKRKRFGDVLKRLGLTTSARRKKKTKRK